MTAVEEKLRLRMAAEAANRDKRQDVDVYLGRTSSFNEDDENKSLQWICWAKRTKNENKKGTKT